MRKCGKAGRKAVVGIVILASLVVASTASSFNDSRLLVVFKQIGDMRMGETGDAVGYIYGDFCLQVAPGFKTAAFPA
jgi:hypothetical protein